MNKLIFVFSMLYLNCNSLNAQNEHKFKFTVDSIDVDTLTSPIIFVTFFKNTVHMYSQGESIYLLRDSSFLIDSIFIKVNHNSMLLGLNDLKSLVICEKDNVKKEAELFLKINLLPASIKIIAEHFEWIDKNTTSVLVFNSYCGGIGQDLFLSYSSTLSNTKL